MKSFLKFFLSGFLGLLLLTFSFKASAGSKTQNSISSKQELQNCFKKAGDKKEQALNFAEADFKKNTKDSQTAHKLALEAAQKLSDKVARRKALSSANSQYRNETENLKKQLSNERKQAWDNFTQDKKSCKK